MSQKVQVHVMESKGDWAVCLDHSLGDAAAEGGRGVVCFGVAVDPAFAGGGTAAGCPETGGASSFAAELALGASRSSSGVVEGVVEGVAKAPLLVWEAAGGERGSPGLGTSGPLDPKF